jgi:hypothetical protein
MTTGKNKQQFESWYLDWRDKLEFWVEVKKFYEVPFEMQLGVYLAFYSSLGYEMEKVRYMNDEMELTDSYEVCFYDYTAIVPLLVMIFHKDENEAYKKALIQINNVLNEKE